MAKLKRILGSENHAVRRVLLIGSVFVVGFVALAVAGTQLWEWSNSTWFCTNVCHDVHPEEPAAYQDSYHARVKCVECHMGRVSTLRTMVLKASHFQHLPETIFRQYEHPRKAETLRPANESCERCHWPPSFHGDTVWEIRHFEPDEQNTEERTYLILKTGGGQRERGLGYGIHWHIENPVEYIAADERKQDIRWVRVTLPDGRTVEYNDVANPLSAEEIAEAEPRVMDCVDCHNQMGHPFQSPEQLIDVALAEDRLSTDLPYIKRELEGVLSAAYASQDEAFAAIDSLVSRYQSQYPEAAASYGAEIDQAFDLARELLVRLIFEEPGITWRSFPNNGGHGGHKDFPGCFRCHDGKHVSDEGESIRLHCNICHSIPVTVGPEDRPPEMPIVSIQEPPSHLETSFMADHRFQANSACVGCHGEIAFGSDDSSFCANSACHGRAWPSVDLDAAFPHPIELEGKHAEVWCHDCHNGVRDLEYACASCHEASAQPHYGETCDDCHTPEGWRESVALLLAQSPPVPHTLDGRDECSLCHDPVGEVRPAPADHEGRTDEQCLACHVTE